MVHNSLRCLLSNWCLAAKENVLAAVVSAVCLSVPCENGVQRSSAGSAPSVGAQSITTLQGWKTLVAGQAGLLTLNASSECHG